MRFVSGDERVSRRRRLLALLGSGIGLATVSVTPLLPVRAADPPVAAAASSLVVPAPIRVALFADSGSKTGGDAVETCLTKGMPTGKYTCFRVTGDDIRRGALDNADVVVMGGGSGHVIAQTLKPEGLARVKAFVEKGGGYVGICAGSYLASSYYSWSLHILNAKVIDREHWARGGGMVTLRLTEAGKTRLARADDTVQCRYNQGPLLGPFDEKGLPAYETLAVFDTEIAKKGAPVGVMKGTTAMASAMFGKGRVLCISPHPEATRGLDGILRRVVDWVAPAAPASAEGVKP